MSPASGLEQVMVAVNSWLVFMLGLTAALATMSAVATFSAGQIRSRARARRLHEPHWVGRDELAGPGIWRVGDSVAPVNDDGKPLTWGMAGTSTVRLAELILREVVGERAATRLSARFATQVLAELPAGGFVLPESHVRAWLRRGGRPLLLSWPRLSRNRDQRQR
jgi:hypothetical protein